MLEARLQAISCLIDKKTSTTDELTDITKYCDRIPEFEDMEAYLLRLKKQKRGEANIAKSVEQITKLRKEVRMIHQ